MVDFPPRPAGIPWVPIADMPEAWKDGRRILARVADYEERWPGRVFEVRHEGLVPDLGLDLGWSLFPGYGGVPLSTFSHVAAINPPEGV